MRKSRSPLPLPAAAPGSLFPWSYSKLSMFEKCPAQAKFRYIEKRPEEKNPAMERGNEVHKTFEQWILAGAPKAQAKVGPTSRFVEYGAGIVAASKKAKKGLIVEELWGHAENWQATMHRSATWLWVKMDLCSPSENLVVDWKTGKKYNNHLDQGLLYGTSYLIKFPDAPRVKVEFAYTDLGEVSGMTVERKEVPAIQKDFNARVKAMREETRFAPKPSRLCGWCSYSRAKGGPCLAG